jgi:hypothetical protein
MDFGLAGEQKAPGFSAALASDLTAHRTGLSAADLERMMRHLKPESWLSQERRLRRRRPRRRLDRLVVLVLLQYVLCHPHRHNTYARGLVGASSGPRV